MSDSKKNKVHIYLKFYDFNVHPDEISKALKLEPTRKGLKGEKFYIGTKKKIERKYSSNWWQFGQKYDVNGKWPQEFIDQFTEEIIEPRKNEIKDIIAIGDGELSVCPYFYNDTNPGFHFEHRVLKAISEANLPINMDIYCL